MSQDTPRGVLPTRFLRRLLGPIALGMIDYFRFPSRRDTWGGPFNGQPKRCELFSALIGHLAPDAIVETGTYLGTTTEFMASTGLPIFSVEDDPRYFGYARARLWRRGNIRLIHADSRNALRWLLQCPKFHLFGKRVFFYLDAHWNNDLPLLEELSIIFARCATAVVMVDDFQVPLDPGYGYDDYGPRNTIDLAHIAPVISAHRLVVFYPSVSSTHEGGMRRGCVILAKREAHWRTLSSLPLLRPDETSIPS